MAATTPRTAVRYSEFEKPACDGTMMCRCLLCRLEREQRVQNGVRNMRQPWRPKSKRKAA